MSDVFERLQPPRGGLARLQHAIEQRRAPSKWPRLAIACAASLPIAVAFPSLQQWQARATLDRQIASAISGAGANPTPIAVENGAALLVADRPDVRIYWIATAPRD